MDRKKVIIAIILFVFLGLTVFTFANPDNNVSELSDGKVTDTENKPSDNIEDSSDETIATNDDNDSTGGRLTISQSTGTVEENTTTDETITDNNATTPVNPGINADNNAGTGNSEEVVTNNEDYKELIALVDELVKKVNNALELSDLTDARDFNVTKDVIKSVANVTDSSVKKTLEERLESVLPILNDTKEPVVLVNDEAVKETYNGNVTITVKDETVTKTKSIKHNGKNVDNIDELVDGNYEITIIDAAYNETTIKFAYDATAPSVDYLAILNRTNYDSYYMVANKGNLIRVLAYFDEELAVAPKMKIEGGSEVIMNGGSKSGELYVYSYDYRITDVDTIAEGDLKVKVYGFADKVGNTVLEENAITEIKHYKYNVVNYDITKPELNYNNGNSFVSKEIIVDDVNPDYITIWSGKTGKTETIYKNKYLLSVDYETDNARFDVTAYDKAGNVSDTKIIWIDNKAPQITGIGVVGNENVELQKGASYRSVTLNVEDMNLKEIGLVDEDGNKTPLQKFDWNPNGHTYEVTFDDDQNYTLYAIDRAGNESVVTFVIDNVAPTAEVKYSNYPQDRAPFTAKEVVVTLIPSEEILEIEGWTKIEDENGLRYEKTFTQSSKGTIVITDLAGNTSKVSYDVKRIDSSLPGATVTISNVIDNKVVKTNNDVIVTILADEAIRTPEGWEKVEDRVKEREYTKTYSENGTYYVSISDKAGNTNTLEIVISGIDKENPTAEVKYSNVNDKGNIYSVKEATVTIIPSEEIVGIEGWTKVEDENGLRYEKTFTQSSKGTIVITDLAGNTSKVSYDLKRVDSNPPQLTIFPNKNTIKHEVNTPFVDPGYTAYDKVDKDVTRLVRVSYRYNDNGNWISDLDVLDTSKLGEWQIVYTAYDKNGNTTTLKRPVKIVDTTDPAISFAEGTSVINIELGNGTYTELGATVTDNYDGTYIMDKPSYINMYTIDGAFIGQVNEVNTNVEGRYNLVYVATDSSKNEIKATRMVYVKPAVESQKSIVMLADKQTFMFDNLNDTVNYINSSNYENITVSIKGSHNWDIGLNYGIGGANTKTVKFLGIGNNVTITNTGLGYSYAGVKTNGNTVVTFENIVWDDETFYNEGGAWEHYYSEFEGNFKFINCTFNHPPITLGEYNYTFKNCKFNSHFYRLSENTYGTSTEYGAWINGGNVTFDGCTFTGLRGMKMHNTNGTSIKNIIIKNNTFDDLDKNSKEHAILIDNVSSDTTVKISNNKFINIGTYSTTGFAGVEYTTDNQEITK